MPQEFLTSAFRSLSPSVLGKRQAQTEPTTLQDLFKLPDFLKEKQPFSLSQFGQLGRSLALSGDSNPWRIN